MGLTMLKDATIDVCVSVLAVAVNAMIGTSQRARNPPIMLKVFLKSVPLKNIDFHNHTMYTAQSYTTSNQSVMQ